MITGEYEQLQEIAGRSVCAADGGHLTVAWHKDQSCYYIKCGTCDICKAVQTVNGPVKSDKVNPDMPTAVTLGGVPAVDLATGELLAPAAVQALVQYADRYHLDAGRGHVVVMYSQPYITIDGYLYHANRSGVAYTLESRPLNKEEREIYMIEDKDHAWISFVKITETGTQFSGLGIVTADEMTATSKKKPDKLAAPVVAAKPWQMAQKRAEWQALRRAFPIGKSEEVDNAG